MSRWIEESDDWYEVVNDEHGEVAYIEAQFIDYDDARWYVNFKDEQDDDA